MNVGHFRRKPAQSDPAGILPVVQNRDAGQEAHVIADVFLAAVSKFIKRDHVLDIGGVTLLVHRDCLAAHGLFRDDLEFLEHDRPVLHAATVGAFATELEILRDLPA